MSARGLVTRVAASSRADLDLAEALRDELTDEGPATSLVFLAHGLRAVDQCSYSVTLGDYEAELSIEMSVDEYEGGSWHSVTALCGNIEVTIRGDYLGDLERVMLRSLQAAGLDLEAYGITDTTAAIMTNDITFAIIINGTVIGQATLPSDHPRSVRVYWAAAEDGAPVGSRAARLSREKRALKRSVEREVFMSRGEAVGPYPALRGVGY